MSSGTAHRAVTTVRSTIRKPARSLRVRQRRARNIVQRDGDYATVTSMRDDAQSGRSLGCNDDRGQRRPMIVLNRNGVRKAE